MEGEIAGRDIVQKIVERRDYRSLNNGSKEVVFRAVVRSVQQYGATRREESEENDRDQRQWFPPEVGK